MADARTLYIDSGFSQESIARMLDVSPNTITRWKKAGAWDALKHARLGGRHEMEVRIIDQMRILDEEVKAGGKAYTLAQTNALLNLKKSLDGLKDELSLPVLVETGIAFTSWTHKNHPEDAPLILARWDGFMKHWMQTEGL